MKLDKDLQSIQAARELVKNAKNAQHQFAKFSQEQVDKIVAHIAVEGARHAEVLAKLAHQETGFGRWQDKILKNIFASTQVHEHIRDMKTVGIIADDSVNKIMEVGVPLGVIIALVPSTNPTSTILYKTLIALKAGNAIIFSPHPNAKECSQQAIDVVKRAALDAGAPEGIIDGVTLLTMPATETLMKSKDVSLILATGGEGMVRAAYASGTPTISGGPGNGPAFIERSANIPQAVKDIITSKTFDNGVICASEQSIIVERCIYEQVHYELLRQGAYLMNEQESDKLAAILLRPNGMINPAIVGQCALTLAQKAGFTVPEITTVLVSLQTTVSSQNPYSREKLCPVLGLYIEDDWHAACERVLELLTNEGMGHTLVIHTQNPDIVREFALEKPVYRMLVNTPAALGGIGATTNISPALTLGCGALGGGSSSDNVGPMNLLNVRRVGYGVRSIEELRKPAVVLTPAPACQPVYTSYAEPTSVAPAQSVSIFEDTRFMGATPAVAANTVSSTQGDDRFAAVVASANDEINAAQVEHIIKQVMGRLAP
ncbi:acetaldehyde dehydrogenase (acetylating) [Photobacterium toruni]|jgi:acetaldehyde dehydrogenase (acetylating)|uniref:acetaldehyde dehydrogenase (acetylating) n=1 Tax=Photobacterium TaxID=657 RepID=UPI001E28DCFE|nr:MULTISPECIES: acetaldehyde dehydrogenase (acetylating) [Photobacterium]MCD9462267.1 acetaldehyde dehydrogenase (acetylating) [Photobacterium phosphoreum]MCD9505967.1 acetaldehyde dehydrogenase (acetylating) [Photobacterium phosphoreum]MCD9518596.1 acetaldehyde dehydrogenase (acetylating) [Photobacterium phosphoreum]MEC6815093.1 acetaldehyde dehydrogenase (acetylating) [Photobacterium toruni]MEC6881848.1 acetaldehyde dehydrogenase (acetylating) [Photobacterium piscicola]